MQAIWYFSTCTLCFIVKPLQYLAGMAAAVKNDSQYDITDQRKEEAENTDSHVTARTQIKMQVSMTSQTNPRHRKEEAQNTSCHVTAITQSADMIAKLEKNLILQSCQLIA